MADPALATQADAIRAMVEPARRVLVLSHKDPDGDTLGSALAMRDVLLAMGKEVVNRVPLPISDAYDFLPGFDTLNPPRDGWEPDLVVVMDASNLERLADVMTGVPQGTPIVNIDHHVSNTRFGQVDLVVPEASSTAEVAFDLLRQWGVEITPDVATNLYVGVLTDTGSFRHENTSYRALSIAAELVKAGAHAGAIAEAVYKRRKLSTVKLEALVMSRIQFECEDRLVWTSVTQDDLRRAGAAMEDTEGLIDALNSVEGLEIAILYKEMTPAMTKISVRTRSAVSANEVAAVFGGGGHARAAGAEIHLPVAEAVEPVLAAARRFLDESAAGAASQGSR